jgi:hypothetical protein
MRCDRSGPLHFVHSSRSGAPHHRHRLAGDLKPAIACETSPLLLFTSSRVQPPFTLNSALMATHWNPAFALGVAAMLLLVVVIVRVVGKFGEGQPLPTEDEEREDNIW